MGVGRVAAQGPVLRHARTVGALPAGTRPLESGQGRAEELGDPGPGELDRPAVGHGQHPSLVDRCLAWAASDGGSTLPSAASSHSPCPISSAAPGRPRAVIAAAAPTADSPVAPGVTNACGPSRDRANQASAPSGSPRARAAQPAFTAIVPVGRMPNRSAACSAERVRRSRASRGSPASSRARAIWQHGHELDGGGRGTDASLGLVRGGHREVVTPVGRLEHGAGGDDLRQVVAGPLAGQRQAVAESVHRPVHVAEGVRRDGLHQPQLAGPVGVVGQRRGDPPVFLGRPVDAVPERRPGDLQPRPLTLGHPPARQQPLGPGQAGPDALHEQPTPAQRQRHVDGGVDLSVLQQEAERLEVVVVRAADVLDELVGQRRIAPQAGEPLRVPGAGDVQPAGRRRAPRGPGRGRCAASGTPRLRRSARRRPGGTPPGRPPTRSVSAALEPVRARAAGRWKAPAKTASRSRASRPAGSSRPTLHEIVRRNDCCRASRPTSSESRSSGRSTRSSRSRTATARARPATSSSARGRPSTRRTTSASTVRSAAPDVGHATVGEAFGEEPYGVRLRQRPSGSTRSPTTVSGTREVTTSRTPGSPPGWPGPARPPVRAPTRPRRRARPRRWSAGPGPGSPRCRRRPAARPW